MRWQDKIFEGLLRIAIVMGVIVGAIAVIIIFYYGDLNINNSLLVGTLVFLAGFFFTIFIFVILNWIIKGFIDWFNKYIN